MMQIIATLLLVYFSMGFVFAIAFAARGYKKIDTGADSAGLRLRLLWMPGSAALWPVLALQWKRASANTQNRGEGT